MWRPILAAALQAAGGPDHSGTAHLSDARGRIGSEATGPLDAAPEKKRARKSAPEDVPKEEDENPGLAPPAFTCRTDANGMPDPADQVNSWVWPYAKTPVSSRANP